MNDQAATQYLTHLPDRRSAWRVFTAGAGQWVVRGAGWWTAELRTTGEVVGWILRPKFWRQGLATEATKAALDYGVEKFAAQRVVALIAKDNVASIKVSEKLGMSYEADVPFDDKTIGLYACAVAHK